MGIPEGKLKQVLAYCAIPEPDERDLLVLDDAWDAARAYLEGAGVPEPAEEDPKYPLWMNVMKALTLDNYDQRGAQFDQGKLQDNPAFRRQIAQLELGFLPGGAEEGASAGSGSRSTGQRSDFSREQGPAEGGTASGDAVRAAGFTSASEYELEGVPAKLERSELSGDTP